MTGEDEVREVIAQGSAQTRTAVAGAPPEVIDGDRIRADFILRALADDGYRIVRADADLRERVARAIFDADRTHIDALNGFPDDGQPEWDDAYAGIKENCLREADAVLAALAAGEPGETLYRRCQVCDGNRMLDSPYNPGWYTPCLTCRNQGYIPATGPGEGGGPG